jgi:hypothetical protein
VIGEIVEGRTFGELLSSEHKDYFYIMHLSYGSDKTQRERPWKYDINKDENMIGLDWCEVTRDWFTLSESEQQALVRDWTRDYNLFCGIKVDDYVAILNGTFSLHGIAKVTGATHEYDQNLESDDENPNCFFDHIRKVKWIKRYQYDGCILSQRLTLRNTLAKVTPRTRSPGWKVLTTIDL